MDIAKGILVDGYSVHCDVILLSSGRFKLELATRPQRADVAERVWQLPGAPIFDALAEAERYAVQVLRGVSRVDSAGQPVFCWAPDPWAHPAGTALGSGMPG